MPKVVQQIILEKSAQEEIVADRFLTHEEKDLPVFSVLAFIIQVHEPVKLKVRLSCQVHHWSFLLLLFIYFPFIKVL